MIVLASDNFNRADSGTTQVEEMGSSWLTNSAGLFFKILTNTARVIAAGSDAAERNTDVTWPADQYSKCTLGTSDTTHAVGVGYGPAVRMDTSGTVATFYRLCVSTVGYELGRFNAGAFTSIASGSGTTFADGDTAELRVDGSATVTLRMYKNSSQFGGDQTDSTGSRITSGAAGIAYSGTAFTVTSIDSWEGGNLNSPSPMFRGH